MLTASEVIEAPFGLIRRRPRAVATWGLFHLAAVLAAFAVMRPIQAMIVSGDGPGVGMAWTMLERLFLVQGAILLIWTFLLTAAQRAVLRPDRSRFAYLRLGMDELRMVVLAIVLLLLSYAALVAGFVAVTALVMALRAPFGMAGTAVAAALLGLGLLSLLIWIEVRLSLIFPLTLLRRRFVLGESWRLTRGRFWTLFGAYFVLFVLIIAIWTAAASLNTSTYLTALMSAGVNRGGMDQAARAQALSQMAIGPLTVAGWLLSAAGQALATALIGGAVATAARALATDREAIADTFA